MVSYNEIYGAPIFDVYDDDEEPSMAVQGEAHRVSGGIRRADGDHRAPIFDVYDDDEEPSIAVQGEAHRVSGGIHRADGDHSGRHIHDDRNTNPPMNRTDTIQMMFLSKLANLDPLQFFDRDPTVWLRNSGKFVIDQEMAEGHCVQYADLTSLKLAHRLYAPLKAESRVVQVGYSLRLLNQILVSEDEPVPEKPPPLRDKEARFINRKQRWGLTRSRA